MHKKPYTLHVPYIIHPLPGLTGACWRQYLCLKCPFVPVIFRQAHVVTVGGLGKVDKHVTG